LENTRKSIRSIHSKGGFVVSYLQVDQKRPKSKHMNTNLAENQVAAVRYIVNDVDSAVNFYTNKLSFQVDMHVKSKFASLSLGNLRLYINSPGAGGAGQAMPDGAIPAPGGWNRFQLQVKNIESIVEDLKKAGQNSGMKLSQESGANRYYLKTPRGIL